MKNPKYFICPMSKEIIDSVIELDSNDFALLPTRRQIDFDGGYVSGLNTVEFHKYVRSKSNILLERDHSGPNQGTSNDDGRMTYETDSLYFDIIHIDPWKVYSDFADGAYETVETIKHIHGINPNIYFEIGTEETIRPFKVIDIRNLLEYCKANLSEEQFDKIYYVVVQSGVKLDLANKNNIGVYNQSKLFEMSSIIKSYDKKIKEHNGDYLSNFELELRFNNGVDSINIGPEIPQIQTATYLKNMNESEIDEFYKICLESKKWEKWVTPNFDITNKIQMITICGHYNYDKLVCSKDVKLNIKEEISNKLRSLPL